MNHAPATLSLCRLAFLMFVAWTVHGQRGLADEGMSATAILDKAMNALGGEEALAKLKAATWKAKGKIRYGEDYHDFTSSALVQGLTQYRLEMASEFKDIKVNAVEVLYGDAGYRNIGAVAKELDAEGIANLKRDVYLLVVPMTLVPLKSKNFKLEVLPMETVGDRPVVGIKATAPDGKDFRLYFDKTSGLPVKLVANIVSPMEGEFTHVTLYANYKDFGGVKKATKITVNRDGAKFMEQEITDFKVVDKLDKSAFIKPD
jgi:hypothetical protein